MSEFPVTVLGMAFAYFVVFPVMFKFFTSVAPQGADSFAWMLIGDQS